MMDDVYEKLADALHGLPNGFPRTATGSHIKLLKYLYTPDEAGLAGQLGLHWEAAEDVARKINLLPKEVIAGLLSMVRQGKVLMDRREGKMKFRLAPFIVGSYEASGDKMNAEMASLMEDYMNDGGVYGIMEPQPALHRVLPAVDSVDLEWILPYENVISILENAKTFHVQDCICRLQQAALGQGCDAPVHNCLSFSTVSRAPKPGDIPKEEAFRLIDDAEKAGLVHSVSNVVEGLSYICNCCGCCCGILRGITKWGIENTMARANYEAVVEPETCSGCKVCVKRCQVSAVSMAAGKAAIDRNRCIGCGLCQTTCKPKAIRLIARPESEQITPPEDFGQWERERLKNRGMS